MIFWLSTIDQGFFLSTGLSFPVSFLGHMVPLEDKEEIMFIGTPHFDSLGDLISSTTYLTNIPQDNMTMEIMFMNEQRRADVEMRYRRHHYVFFIGVYIMPRNSIRTPVCKSCYE